MQAGEHDAAVDGVVADKTLHFVKSKARLLVKTLRNIEYIQKCDDTGVYKILLDDRPGDGATDGKKFPEEVLYSLKRNCVSARKSINAICRRLGAAMCQNVVRPLTNKRKHPNRILDDDDGVLLPWDEYESTSANESHPTSCTKKASEMISLAQKSVAAMVDKLNNPNCTPEQHNEAAEKASVDVLHICDFYDSICTTEDEETDSTSVSPKCLVDGDADVVLPSADANGVIWL